MGHTVYILYSNSIKKYYAGQTGNLVNRLKEHNSGETKSIRHGCPWELMWHAEVSNRSEAMVLEERIKKRGITRFLRDIDCVV